MARSSSKIITFDSPINNQSESPNDSQDFLFQRRTSTCNKDISFNEERKSSEENKGKCSAVQGIHGKQKHSKRNRKQAKDIVREQIAKRSLEKDHELRRNRDRARDRDDYHSYRSLRTSSRERYLRRENEQFQHKSFLTRRSRSPLSKTPPRVSASSRTTSLSDLPQHERDKRTVFVAQLHGEARQREIRDFFEKRGTGLVRDVKLIADKGSRRMKGLGYIEFQEEKSVDKAIALNGEFFMGIPLIVQRTEAEKNRAAEAASFSLNGEKKHPVTTNALYVGNLPIYFAESDIRMIFEPHGHIENVQILKDHDGNSKGAAFVTFSQHDDCKLALNAMQDFIVNGMLIKCNSVSERHLPWTSELDDSETVGLKLNPQSRAELMHKLARSDRPVHSIPFLLPPDQLLTSEKSPTHAKTRCLILTNMFNPLEENDQNWEKEIEAEVKEECQSSYGPVAHIRVLKSSPGHVYIKFETFIAAEKALFALNGRWFSSRRITANYLSETVYNTKFPDAIVF